MPSKYPIWIEPIAKNVFELLTALGAMQHFRDMLVLCWKEHVRQQEAQRTWNNKRRDYFIEKVQADPGLQNEAAEPAGDDWYFDKFELNDGHHVSGWCPSELLVECRPRVRSLLPLRHFPDLPQIEEVEHDCPRTLAEKYAICALIHDVVYWGFEKIGVLDHTLENDTSAFGLYWQCVCEPVIPYEFKQHDIERFFMDVQDDLNTTLAGKKACGSADLRIPEKPLKAKQPSETETSLKETGMADTNAYLVADLCEMTGLGNRTLNKYAKAAGVPTPDRGKRNHKYTGGQIQMILQRIVDTGCSSKVRSRCEEILQTQR